MAKAAGLVPTADFDADLDHALAAVNGGFFAPDGSPPRKVKSVHEEMVRATIPPRE